MEERLVGRSGLRVSRLGLGTLTWGRDTDEHEAADQFKEFVDAGGTLVDTAASYGEGAAEELLGSLLGWVMAARALKPVLAIAQTAQSISGSNLSLRIPTRNAGDDPKAR